MGSKSKPLVRENFERDTTTSISEFRHLVLLSPSVEEGNVAWTSQLPFGCVTTARTIITPTQPPYPIARFTAIAAAG